MSDANIGKPPEQIVVRDRGMMELIFAADSWHIGDDGVLVIINGDIIVGAFSRGWMSVRKG